MMVTLAMASNSYADVSNAAVLFLRIAAGSRAAGMGEAYVAVADDASATHWNPAGLGNYPLYSDWIDVKVPAELRPLTAIAPLSKGGTQNYLSYDVWALSAKGLVRYDNKKWTDGEVFSTKTDETLRDKISSYFNVSSDDALALMATRVAEANSPMALQDLEALRESILASIPEDYKDRERIQTDLDSAVALYTECRVNWERIGEARDKLREGMEDSLLTEVECDRISVAIERSRMRFLPEELHIPYGALFTSPITSMVATGDMLFVGSADGLARHNGRSWAFFTINDGLASTNIKDLVQVGERVVAVTDVGLNLFNGLTFRPLATLGVELPEGDIEAVGGNAHDIYAVVNHELYHYSDHTEQWTNLRRYTVMSGDTPEVLADRMSIYKSQAEKDAYLEKFNRLAVELTDAEVAALPPGLIEPAVQPAADDSTDEATEAAPVVTDGLTVGDNALTLTPGKTISMPFAAEFKSRVNAIFIENGGRLWLGTDYGVVYYDDFRWHTVGYKKVAADAGMSLADLAAKYARGNDPEITAQQIRDVNGFDGDEIPAVDSIIAPSNPASWPVARIASKGEHLFFATSEGLIEFDGKNTWSVSGVRDMGKKAVIGMASHEVTTWIGSDDRLAVRAQGRSELTLMHVNWLPDLADDLYYEFLGFVTQKEGWGTFGGNVTFISYGKFVRTDEVGNIIGEFDAFDIAFSLSYGTSLSTKLKGGLSTKVIFSRLSQQGAGEEKGSGESFGFAVDFGLMYLMSNRLTLGMAITNLGPQMAYIDAAQSDDLPRNLALGFSYKILNSEYNQFIVTAEGNKILVGMNDPFSTEIKEVIWNAGAEYTYANLISARAGYIYDQEGSIKTVTLGMGLSLFDRLKFDFAYIPSQDDLALANTMRVSLGVLL